MNYLKKSSFISLMKNFISITSNNFSIIFILRNAYVNKKLKVIRLTNSFTHIWNEPWSYRLYIIEIVLFQNIETYWKHTNKL